MDDADEEIFWELIGPLQSNKVKKAAERFYRIQSVDRIKIVNLLQRHAAEAERSLRILLQINTGNDPSKSGARLEDASALLERALSQPNLKVDGLMTIAPLSSDLNIARKSFASLRKCREELAESFKVDLPELSMGMSGDMQEAILEGSTIVRVGTALFGKRDYA
jgi:pyridoxal phosphate enzyme (YggS family)